MHLRFLAETGSTNSDMLACAERGEGREGDWLVAGRQTSGRGRQGRRWRSPIGNLYATGLVRLRPGDPPAPTLALVAAVALVDTLDIPGARLKWPNDVMVGNAKLAGILLERSGQWVAVGCGANVAVAPTGLERAVTSLAELGIIQDLADLAARLAGCFSEQLRHWREDGLASTLSAWLARAHPIGTPLTAEAAGGERVEGSFAGLTGDGGLQLRLADGSVHVIHAGDVFLIEG